MGLTVYNDTAAPVNAAPVNNDQAEPDKVHWDILVAAHARTGVTQGVGSECAVTESAPQGQTVEVADGETRHTNTPRTIVAGQVAMPAADVTNPRWDLVVIDNTGAKQVRQGTADANPCYPNLTAGDACLAAVYRPANDNTISNDEIQDMRVLNLIESVSESLFNVKDYGAAGDGTTDDRAAIQSAIDAAETQGGGTVYFPTTATGGSVSYYRVTKPPSGTSALTMGSNITLKGDGLSTKIVLENDSDNTIDLIVMDQAAIRPSVQDLTLSVSPQGTSTKANAAIRLDGAKQMLIRNIAIQGEDEDQADPADRWQYGIYVDDTPAILEAGTTKDSYITQFNITCISGDADAAGVRVSGVPGSRHLYILMGSIQSRPIDGDPDYTTPGDAGLWLEAFDGFHMEQVETIVFRLPLRMDASSGGTFITNTRFVDSYFEVPDDQGAFIDTGSNAITTLSFLACNFYGTGGGTRMGMKIDVSGAGVLKDIMFGQCHFQIGQRGLQVNNTGGGTMEHIAFSACRFDCDPNDIAVEINANATDLQFVGCIFDGTTATGVAVNGSDNKILQIIGCSFDGGLTTLIDWSGYSGNYLNIVVTANTPAGANRSSLPSCRVRKSADQFLSANARTKVTFDTVSGSGAHDPFGLFDDANDRIIFNRAGRWLITAQASFTPNADSYRGFFIQWRDVSAAVNIDMLSQFVFDHGVTGVGARCVGSCVIDAEKDDYVELDVQLGAGGDNVSSFGTFFAAVCLD